MPEPKAKLIPEDAIRTIRESCSIVDVISDYVSLKNIGANHRGLCPFHNEKTPSFFVNESRRSFYCFGCGERGDVFSFLMKRESMNFQEAVRHLAQRCGIALPERRLSPQEAAQLEEREQLFAVNAAAARLYHKLLLTDRRAERAREYLAQRGISGETVKAFGIGFAPDAWDTLVTHLRSSRASLEKAQQIGLVASKQAGRYYDRFRNRIIFPIQNVARQVIGFGGRILDDGEPKYLNSPESQIYSKRSNLYGLHVAAQHISRENRAVIVEGYLDVLTLHQAGITNAVAALGTALTEQQIQLLRRYSQQIITVFDADPAGEKAMVRSLEPFLASHLSPRLVLLPPGEDPDSFVKQQGAEQFRAQMDKAGLLLDFVIEKTIGNFDISDPRGKVAACDAVLAVITELPDPMERQLYIQKLARRLGVQEAQITARLRGSRQGTSAAPQAQRTEKRSDFRKNAEKILLKLLVSTPEISAAIEQTAILDDFSDPTIQKICYDVLERTGAHQQLDLEMIMNGLAEDAEKRLLAEVAYGEDFEGAPQKILEDCIRDVRLKKNTRARERMTAQIKQAEASRDEARAHECQRAYQELLQEKRRILAYKLDADNV